MLTNSFSNKFYKELLSELLYIYWGLYYIFTVVNCFVVDVVPR